MTRVTFRLKVDQMRSFMWFPEAVVRGALGYYWKSCGEKFSGLYALFFGMERNVDSSGNLIATPPRGARIVITRATSSEDCADLELTLFGNNADKVPLFATSLQVLGREGIGEECVHFEVVGEGEIKSGLLQDFLSPEPQPLSKSCKLTLDAPMTLRKTGGEFLYRWDTVSFACNLVQRAVQLNQFYGTGDLLDWNVEELSYDFRNVYSWSDTHRQERCRISSRQRKHVDYSGFCGVVFLHDITRENYTLLRIGEQLAVGKNTVFGSGGYKLESV